MSKAQGAEEATMQSSKGELQAKGTARAGGGSGLKIREVVSSGRKNQTSMKKKLRFSPWMILVKFQNKTHEISHLKNDITQKITKKKRILQCMTSSQGYLNLKTCYWIVTVTKIA